MAATAITQPRSGFWASVQEAIRGTKQDFTEADWQVGATPSYPMVLEMMMESLFAIVNVFWVTRLGANAIATVGLTESMMTIVFAVGIGVSMSTTAMVARRIGEKDTRGAATAGVQAIILGIGLSILMGVPAFLLAPRLLRLHGRCARVNLARQQLHRHRAGRECRGDSAVSEQRHLPGGRRRIDRDAGSVDLEPDQPCAGSLPDLWTGPVS